MMNIPNSIGAARYDITDSRVLLREADGSSWFEYVDFATLIDVLSTGVVPNTLLPPVGSYALALVAHEHSGWPTESRRAALIQAAQQVRDACPTSAALSQALDAALTLADAALMRGDADIEGRLVDFGEAQGEG